MSDNNGTVNYVDDTQPFMLSIPQYLALLGQPVTDDNISHYVRKVLNEPEYHGRVTKEPGSGHYFLDNSDQHFKMTDYGKHEYKVYINSDEWSVRRLLFLSRDGYRCRTCNQPHIPDQPLVVHHATYDRLGNESNLDCVTLCQPCHQLFHQKPPNTPAKNAWDHPAVKTAEVETMSSRVLAKIISLFKKQQPTAVGGSWVGLKDIEGLSDKERAALIVDLKHKFPGNRLAKKYKVDKAAVYELADRLGIDRVRYRRRSSKNE